MEVVNTCSTCGRDFRWPARRRNCPRCDQDDPEPKDTYATRHGPRFQELREAVLDRDGHRCQGCGITDEDHRADPSLFGGGLHVHHVQPVQDFDDPEDAHTLDNLEALCADCHQGAETVGVTA